MGSRVDRPDKYVTVSIPVALAEAFDELNGELGYWPSRGAFVREAVLEKLREERLRLVELRKAKRDELNAGGGVKGV